MPERCTCGAVLPEDARFCHKCGKPQRDEPLIPTEPEPAASVPPVFTVAAPQVFPSAAISFHNGPAVRIALIAWLATIFCSMIAGLFALPQEIALIWLPASGFLAVYLYRRRTGQRLSMMNGARLGWICGLFGFIMATLVFCGIAILMSDPESMRVLRDQFHMHGWSDANTNQMIQMFRSPSEILGAISISFLLFSALPACGGALGAKLLDRE